MRFALHLAIVFAILISSRLTLSANAAEDTDPTPLDVLDQVGALRAWPFSRGEGVTVAVLDSGIGLHHPEFAERAAFNERELAGLTGVDDDGNGVIDDILGWDFVGSDGVPWVFGSDASAGNGIDDDGDGRVDGGISHGTYAAGLIAGRSMGVAPGAKLLPVRVVDDEGVGGPTTLAAGIDYARQRGASVIYVGVGLPDDDPLVSGAVQRAIAAGVLIIAPAGNATVLLYPAAYRGVVAVAMIGSEPPTRDGGAVAGVDLLAPGTRLYVPRVAALTAEPGYARVSGSSYAAALVAGAAALVRGAAPRLSAADTATVLILGAHQDEGDAAGRLDAGRAVRLALGR